MGQWFSSIKTSIFTDRKDRNNRQRNRNIRSTGSTGSTGSTNHIRPNNKQHNRNEIRKTNLVIKKIYVQRHAASCANTIEKVFGEGQRAKTNNAPDSGISYIGAQQCLQVSDYFTKHPINTSNEPNESTKPLLIFCCSELIRTQQTLCLSWIKYIKKYTQEKNGKIIVLPWLNEVAVMKFFGKIGNSNNYPVSLANTKTKWSEFINNLREMSGPDGKLKDDVCNPLCNLEEYIPDITEWDSLFYLSDIIYRSNSSNSSINKFKNKGKKIEIKRVRTHGFTGLFKRIGDQEQFLERLDDILREYIKVQKIDINIVAKNGIELVIVAHHNSAEGFMNKLIPETIEAFKYQQLVNCEVVSLPEYNLTQKKFVGSLQPITGFERIFPMKFKDSNIRITIKTIKKKLVVPEQVYPLFIIYIEKLKLFLSINNIVATKLLSSGNTPNKNKGIKIKKPIDIFLDMTIIEYKEQLEIFKKHLEKIIADYANAGSNAGSSKFFYNYQIMKKKIDEEAIPEIDKYIINKKQNKSAPTNSTQKQEYERFVNTTPVRQYIIPTNTTNTTNTAKKLRENFFGLCGLTPEKMREIGVFLKI